MGRPPKAADEKRVQVNVRVLPAHKSLLEQMASEAGKPIAAVTENIIASYLERTPQTNALLDRITDQIADLQAKAQGKWHKNLRAWAAVSEMLSFITEDMRPERLQDDEIAQPIMQDIIEKRKMRGVAIRLLAQRGITVSENPTPNALLGTYGRGGIFGRPKRDRLPSRTWERAAIDAMPESQEKQDCVYLFDSIVELDAAIASRESDYGEAIQPYIVAEQEGRQLARPLNALLGPNLPFVPTVPPQKNALGSLLLRYATNVDGEE